MSILFPHLISSQHPGKGCTATPHFIDKEIEYHNFQVTWWIHATKKCWHWGWIQTYLTLRFTCFLPHPPHHPHTIYSLLVLQIIYRSRAWVKDFYTKDVLRKGSQEKGNEGSRMGQGTCKQEQSHSESSFSLIRQSTWITLQNSSHLRQERHPSWSVIVCGRYPLARVESPVGCNISGEHPFRRRGPWKEETTTLVVTKDPCQVLMSAPKAWPLNSQTVGDKIYTGVVPVIIQP